MSRLELMWFVLLDLSGGNRSRFQKVSSGSERKNGRKQATFRGRKGTHGRSNPKNQVGFRRGRHSQIALPNTKAQPAGKQLQVARYVPGGLG